MVQVDQGIAVGKFGGLITVIAGMREEAGVMTVQITEYLDIDLENERWCCNRCGHDLGDARESYKKGCLVRERDPNGFSSKVRAYLDGDLAALDEIPVETGGTPFQRQVWQALREVGPGTTSTYGELARRLGRPTAARAVGAANGRNPVALVVPCHRIVGANGALTGYAGGVERKRWLLKHEGALSKD